MIKMREQLKKARAGDSLSDEEEIDFIFEVCTSSTTIRYATFTRNFKKTQRYHTKFHGDFDDISLKFPQEPDDADLPTSPGGDKGSVVVHDDSMTEDEDEDWAVIEDKKPKKVLNPDDWQQK